MARQLWLLLAYILVMGPLTSLAHSQRIGDESLQPAQYFPRVEQLPTGFVLLPEFDQTSLGQEVVGLVRRYSQVRPSPDRELGAGLTIGVIASSTVERAITVFDTTIGALETQGYVLDGFDDLVGETGVLGRRILDEDAGQTIEEVVVYFRLATINGLIEWADLLDQPKTEHALAVAQLLEARISEVQRQREPLL